MSDVTTKIKVKGEDLISPELKKITKSLEDMNKTSLTKLAMSFDVVTEAAKRVATAISKIYSECSKLVSEYVTVERYNTRLEAIWSNVGKTTGMTAKQVLALADSLEKTTYFEAESIQTAAQTLAATQALSEEGFARALELSVDLAEAMGTDVPSAASTLARALIEPEAGLTRLKTIGVSFTEDEKALIVELNNANKAYEAQQIVLDKVAEKYEGIAKAVADTDTNTLTQINNSLGEIRENFGEAILREIAPALDYVLKQLQEISTWSSKQNEVARVKQALASGSDLTGFSASALQKAIESYSYTNATDFDPNNSARLTTLKEALKVRQQLDAAESAAEAGRKASAAYNNYVQSSSSTSVSTIDTRKFKDYVEEAQDIKFRVDEICEEIKLSFDQVADAASSVFGAVTDLITSSLNSQADALEREMDAAKEAGTLTIQEEQDKKDEINKIRKKAFESEKANSIASALISGAEAIVKFLADPGGLSGMILSEAAGTTTALQVAAIGQQQYTPMATGGIVSSPTHALVGEAGPEAIIPLTKGRNPLEGSGVTINITIEGNADEEVVFNAIERAQRTGKLPSWRYA